MLAGLVCRPNQPGVDQLFYQISGLYPVFVVVVVVVVGIVVVVVVICRLCC